VHFLNKTEELGDESEYKVKECGERMERIMFLKFESVGRARRFMILEVDGT